MNQDKQVNTPQTMQCEFNQDERIQVSIVMPCLNEEGSIGQCISEAQAALASMDLVGEIIVADNNSTDRSRGIATDMGARVVTQSIRGYGNAYLRGLAESRGRYIVIADSDGTYDLTVVPEMIHQLTKGADLVIGSRNRGIIDKGAMPWLHRYVGVAILTFLLNRLSGARVSDAHCGIRAFTRFAMARMCLTTGGMEFASEMIMNAARQNLKIAEIPVHYRKRKGVSKLYTFRDGWRHLRFMMLYSPSYVFVAPGIVFGLVGLILLLGLLGGPVRIAGFPLDIHYMVLGSLFVLLGYQILSLGLFARMYALTEGFVSKDSLVSRCNGVFTLERGIIIGLVVCVVGGGLLVWVLMQWIQQDFGFDSAIPLRRTLLGVTLVLLGTQTIFSSLFLSMLQLRRTRKVAMKSRH